MTSPGTATADELVVLLDDDGTPVGTALKREVHHATTPLHLAFSSYVVDPDGRLLVTRRAWDKATFPGVLTNSCCGHPGPGEAFEDAIRRRLHDELGITEAGPVVPLLPDFRYRAESGGIVENEICPVFAVRVPADVVVTPDPSEVAEVRWMPYAQFHDLALTHPEASPWARLQVEQLGREVDWSALLDGPAARRFAREG